MRIKLCLYTTLFGIALATTPPRRLSPRLSPHVIHEKRATEPLDWGLSHRLNSNKVLPMRFGLTQSNMHRVEELLMEVAHPESPRYGVHYTPAEVVNLFAPSDETISVVTNWLVDSGFDRNKLRLSANKGWILMEATTAEVEELLKTEYHVWNHPSGEQQYGCHNYSIPAHVREHIDLIKPTVHFNHHVSMPLGKRAADLTSSTNNMQLDSLATNPPNLTACSRSVTPDCLRALYAVNYTPVSTTRNSYGIVEFTPQSFLGSDLDLFFKNFAPSLVGVRPNIILIDGAAILTAQQGASFIDSSVNLEYAMTLTVSQPITLLQTGDAVEGASLNNWLDAVDGDYCTFDGGDDPTVDGIYPDPASGGFKGAESCGIVAPPFVISVTTVQDEVSVTPAYANRQCNEYAKLGLLGTTVIYTSGGSGVAGVGGTCLNAQHVPSNAGKVFNPAFPASCPFVTSVGATQMLQNSTVNDPEIAGGPSASPGGGFSNVFPVPSYQVGVVKTFLTLNPPPFDASQFNGTGAARAYPDLSANAVSHPIAISGRLGSVVGAAIAVPVVGSLITLINDARIAAKKSPVGFINPSIYSSAFAPAFNDVVAGSNPGCGTSGFSAARGWDPVTGVGTPNLTKLMALFLALP